MQLLGGLSFVFDNFIFLLPTTTHALTKYDADCPSNRYGYRCKKVCDCIHGECDSVSGCICDAGMNGTHCDIGKDNVSMNQIVPI